MKFLDVLERILVVLSGICVGFAYTPAAGFATLIALDTLLDIRHAVEGKKQ
jgi:hypothetical protein